MSTTHKATPYARDYVAGGDLFLASDYPLSYSLGLEIAEALGERLTEAVRLQENDDISDIIFETLDLVMPVYNSDILREWQDAGCPEPEDIDLGNGIWQQITAGLYESMQQFTYALLDNSDNYEEALERLNTIYPYKTA